MDKYFNENSVHLGHRKRLREKVKNCGLKTLNEHEVVELLLNYVIPRQDTNPLAHNLINNFGSLSKVIDAEYHDLIKVKGMGEESALFFNVLSALFKEYRESKAKDENIIIRNTMDGVNYFRKVFTVENREVLHIVCLSKLGKIISTFNFNGNSDNEINFDFKLFIDKINRDNVHSIMMFHTHPVGKVEPSVIDLLTTQRCVYICGLLGINYLDHIILTDNEYCSMYQCGFIDKMKSNGTKLITPSLEVEEDVFSLKDIVDKAVGELDLENIDLGDISVDEKFRRRH